MGQSYCLTPIPLAPSCRGFSRAGCLISISAPQRGGADPGLTGQMLDIRHRRWYTAVLNDGSRVATSRVLGTLIPVSCDPAQWRSPSI